MRKRRRSKPMQHVQQLQFNNHTPNPDRVNPDQPTRVNLGPFANVATRFGQSNFHPSALKSVMHLLMTCHEESNALETISPVSQQVINSQFSLSVELETRNS
ncbi:hypothetical protein RRG08_052788 [Elysia crispata]|uniref:Uncharacterized protein n=1 Tax=Elysia crispata TaxID=231223 RepID=A0AAE1B6E3_9GAST|nr:hypothetical protein RRG08_052788 [Elysia crispata]